MLFSPFSLFTSLKYHLLVSLKRMEMFGKLVFGDPHFWSSWRNSWTLDKRNWRSGIPERQDTMKQAYNCPAYCPGLFKEQKPKMTLWVQETWLTVPLLGQNTDRRGLHGKRNSTTTQGLPEHSAEHWSVLVWEACQRPGKIHNKKKEQRQELTQDWE
jgi:hypothetical protein